MMETTPMRHSSTCRVLQGGRGLGAMMATVVAFPPDRWFLSLGDYGGFVLAL